MTRRLYRLDQLAPEWVAVGPSWGAGVRWLCGLHGDHALSVMFVNTLDGHPCTADAPRVWRTGSSFSTLTVVSRLQLGACFDGWLVDGDFLVPARMH